MKVIYAKQAEVGRLYQTKTKKPTIVRFQGMKGDRVILETHVKGYGWQAYSEKPEALLIQLDSKQSKIADQKTGGSMAKVKAKAAKKAAKKATVKKDRLPKVGDGKSAPRVSLQGYDLRAHYRSRLAENRARDCAAAREHSCKCRCGGTLHGKNHAPWQEAEDKLFENAPKGAVTAKQILALITKFGGRKAADKQTAKPKVKKKVSKKK